METTPSPAIQALYAGDVAWGRELLAPDDQLSAPEAAAFGRLDRLRALVADDRANANAWSADGFTALHLAIFGRQADAVRLLVEAGADLEAVSRASFAQVRPLGTAAFVGDTEIATLLLDAGADPNGAGSGGSTPLATAEENGDEAMAELLRSRGAANRLEN